MTQFPKTIATGGGAPDIIFEHGTRFDATMFLSQMERLAAEGFGSVSHNSRVLTGENGPHRLNDLVEDTRALLDSFGRMKTVLAGMSVGAFFALEFALKYPERLHGLVLLAGHAGKFSDADQQAWLDAYACCDVDGAIPRDFAEISVQYCFGPWTERNNPEVVRHWVDRWSTLIPARSALHQIRAWIDKPDRLSRLEQIRVPVLVVHGAEDRAVPIDDAIAMVRHFHDVTFVKVPNCGHSVNLEAPDIVNDALVSFMKRVKRAQA